MTAASFRPALHVAFAVLLPLDVRSAWSEQRLSELGSATFSRSVSVCATICLDAGSLRRGFNPNLRVYSFQNFKHILRRNCQDVSQTNRANSLDHPCHSHSWVETTETSRVSVRSLEWGTNDAALVSSGVSLDRRTSPFTSCARPLTVLFRDGKVDRKHSPYLRLTFIMVGCTKSGSYTRCWVSRGRSPTFLLAIQVLAWPFDYRRSSCMEFNGRTRPPRNPVTDL